MTMDMSIQTLSNLVRPHMDNFENLRGASLSWDPNSGELNVYATTGGMFLLLRQAEIEDGLHLGKDSIVEWRLKLIQNGFSPEDVARLSADFVSQATLARLEARRKEYGFTEPAQWTRAK